MYLRAIKKKSHVKINHSNHLPLHWLDPGSRGCQIRKALPLHGRVSDGLHDNTFCPQQVGDT